jgi:hypothetical protein
LGQIGKQQKGVVEQPDNFKSPRQPTEAVLLIAYRTMTSVCRPETIVALIILLTATAALDATLQNYEKSPGLYYDHIGEAQLYSTEWKLLTYVDLQEADRN